MPAAPARALSLRPSPRRKGFRGGKGRPPSPSWSGTRKCYLEVQSRLGAGGRAQRAAGARARGGGQPLKPNLAICLGEASSDLCGHFPWLSCPVFAAKHIPKGERAPHNLLLGLLSILCHCSVDDVSCADSQTLNYPPSRCPIPSVDDVSCAHPSRAHCSHSAA